MTDRERSASLIDPAEDRWMRRLGQRAWAWVGVIVLATLIFIFIGIISDFVVPLVVAFVLGTVFAPLAGLLARHSWPASSCSRRSYRKLLAHDRDEAVARALELGLL